MVIFQILNGQGTIINITKPKKYVYDKEYIRSVNGN
jgi:hypothetical protein